MTLHNRMILRQTLSYFMISAGLALAGACSSSPAAKPAGDASSEASSMAMAASCSAPGMATAGPADAHCASPDGGPDTMQPTSPASCHPGAGAGSDGAASSDGATSGGAGDDGGTANSCDYGPTMFGMSADDDDCKYHVEWSSTPICEGSVQTSGGMPVLVNNMPVVVSGSIFTVVATIKGGGPLIGANTIAEVFTTTPGDAGDPSYCDTKSTHPGPNSGIEFTEGPPGTYTGPIVFDQPGQWTVRFHFHEECEDTLPTSPHGHAAFHITVP